MSDYANGADGSCQECGADTSEDWHLLCRKCFAAEQGWGRGDNERDEAVKPPALVDEVARLRAEVAEMRVRLGRLERGRAA